MEQIGESEFHMNLKNAFNAIPKNIRDSLHLKKDSLFGNPDNAFKGDLLKDMRAKLNKMTDSTEVITYLTKSSKFEDVLDVEMIRKNLKQNAKSDEINMFSMFQSGTQLKGSIYDNGSLHSFWLNNAQRNLISLFFELPDKEIKKGDVWSLKGLNYIQYGNTFNCNKAKKVNEVKLIDIIKRNGETIALIEYNIYEYVDGNIDLIGHKTPSSMSVRFWAKGKFSVEKGKWISYNGLLSIESTGMMNSKSKQKLELIEK